MKEVSAGRHQMRPIRAETRAVRDWLKQMSRRYLMLCVRLDTTALWSTVLYTDRLQTDGDMVRY
jgi:hypothetical protein